MGSSLALLSLNNSDVYDSERFSFRKVDETEIKDLRKKLDTKWWKALIQYLLNLWNIQLSFWLYYSRINTSVIQNVFPENTKTASVIPLDIRVKSPTRTECHILQLWEYWTYFLRFTKGLSNIFSPFLSAYRKNLQFTKHLNKSYWRELSAYNFINEALSYIYLYLTNRMQCVHINNTHNQLENIISGVPQESISGPILSNLLTNYLFYL